MYGIIAKNSPWWMGTCYPAKSIKKSFLLHISFSFLSFYNHHMKFVAFFESWRYVSLLIFVFCVWAFFHWKNKNSTKISCCFDILCAIVLRIKAEHMWLIVAWGHAFLSRKVSFEWLFVLYFWVRLDMQFFIQELTNFFCFLHTDLLAIV